MMQLNKNKKYLLACSYGPDSMALFHMLLKEGYNFSAAFVNYHLREESNEEEKGFKEYCKKNNIEYFIKEVSIFPKGNIENECRVLRYNFFKNLTKENGFDAVLTAHHQDDHIETYLLQKQRKIIPFYWGLNSKREIFSVNVIRPLLEYSKAYLQKYCDDNNVPYSIDKSNLTDIYQRNKIRHEIVEKLSDEERKNLLKEIESANEELNHDYAFVHSIDLYDVDALLRLNNFQFYLAINILAKEVGQHSVSQKYCDELLKALKAEKSNVVVPFRKNISFIKSYGHVHFESDKHVPYSYTIDKPMVLDNEYFYLDFTGDASNRNITKDDYPLTIRNIHPDDQIQIKFYFVKANRLLIDWKVPVNIRWRWPVILNKEGRIIYIPRYQKNFKLSKDINFYVK